MWLPRPVAVCTVPRDHLLWFTAVVGVSAFARPLQTITVHTRMASVMMGVVQNYFARRQRTKVWLDACDPIIALISQFAQPLGLTEKQSQSHLAN
mmetsp:Transcript_19510/g.48738  ORF Transcript_19510/g.48738 Transcript_19510/m.48738 type:complete len:95 (-) Transcript_19510:489-773(-)